MSSPFTLADGISDLLDQGLALLVGTVSSALEPEICRGWGPRWTRETGVLDAMLPLPAAQKTLRNLSTAGGVAFTFTLPTDYNAFQLKGRFLESREPDASDWKRARGQFDAFLKQVVHVGFAPATIEPWFPREACIVAARIEAAFCQTPGPRAGASV